MTTTRGVAVVAGATGLVGSALLQQARAGAWQEIRALVRRPLVPAPEPPVRQVLVDFELPDPRLPLIGATHIFCCLGTTMAQAGSRAAFRRVDFDLPLLVARNARAAGAQHFLLVSALDASPRSWVFYSRVKGELEEAILALGFRSVTIARPSLLLGARPQPRAGERLAAIVTRYAPRRWRAVPAARVASALLAAAEREIPGVTILENPELLQA